MIWIVSPFCEAAAAARIVVYCPLGPTVRMRPVAVGHVSDADAGGGAGGVEGVKAGEQEAVELEPVSVTVRGLHQSVMPYHRTRRHTPTMSV